MKQVKVKKLREDAVLPVYTKKGNSGFDFHALTIEINGSIYNLETIKGLSISPKQTVLIGTGLVFEIEENIELQVRPRSGVSMKDIVVTNSPGTIDSNYKGQVKLIIKNTGDTNFYVNYLDRLAQGVFCPIYTPEIVEVNEVGESERGDKGFGSSGI